MVRLVGIDAPEKSTGQQLDQPYSRQATEYLSSLVLGTLFIESKANEPVEIYNRDPIIEKRLKSHRKKSLLHGTINFRSQVGMADFSILVNDKPEFDFTVEIFPSKIDYQTDYKNMLAEVQEILTGLALEYLRATYHPGEITKVPEPTHLEWIVLLIYCRYSCIL
jgi:hypothetical protein